MELETCIEHLNRLAEQFKQASYDGFGVDLDKKSAFELSGMFQFSADHMASLSETVTWIVAQEKRLLDGIQKAWDDSEDIERNYNDAYEEDCSCFSMPDAVCVHCSKWTKANEKLSKVRAILEELLPTDVES